MRLPGLDPRIAVVGLDDLVRHQLDVTLYHVFLEATTDQALDRVQGIVRIGDRLTLRGLADQHLVVVDIGDDGRRGAVALAVLDHLGLATLHHGYTGVGRAEVNSDNLAHFR